MYVCGGWTGKKITNKVERYSVETKKWEEISPMKERRLAPAVVVLEDLIYVIGGSKLEKSGEKPSQETAGQTKSNNKKNVVKEGYISVYSDTVCEIFIDLFELF